MFDSHCHLHDDRIYDHAEQVIARAEQAGLSGVLLAGVDAASWSRQDRLRVQFESPSFSVGVAYGVHPQIAASLSSSQLDEQLAQLRLAVRGQLSCDGVVLQAAHAIGELGLDQFKSRLRGEGIKETRGLGGDRRFVQTGVVHVHQLQDFALGDHIGGISQHRHDAHVLRLHHHLERA